MPIRDMGGGLHRVLDIPLIAIRVFCVDLYLYLMDVGKKWKGVYKEKDLGFWRRL